MRRDRNVSVAMNEDEYKSLLELIEELDRQSLRSIKPPNQAESIRHAIRFTKDNIDMPKMVEDLKMRLQEVETELEESKRENELFKNHS
ncbi:hypothetical protein CV093_03960 [Oceanobacillus sp. 143]|nr:hypothetical protein CV093_03960 [Oceanobacillus sp. 143]